MEPMEIGIVNFRRRSNGTNNDKCSVFGCNSTASKNLSLSFHRFPIANDRFLYSPGDVPGRIEKMDIREVWKAVTNIQRINQKTKICSMHFLKTDYEYGGKQCCSICTEDYCLIYTHSFDDIAVTNKCTLMRRVLKKNAVPSCRLPEQTKKLNIDPFTSNLPKFKNVEVQVNVDSFLPRCLKNKLDLEIATGIESFEILNSIVNVVGEACKDKCKNDSLIMSTINRITMTYVKLKQNIDYNFLAILFNCYSAEHCEQIFHSTVQTLSKCLRTSIEMSSEEKLLTDLQNLPEYMKNVKIILDCIDIFIEGFDAPYKIIIGSTPAGLIIYISELHYGYEIDLVVFQQSNLSKLLVSGDSVMVDNSLLIDEVCKQNGWNCIRPKTKNQMKYLNRFYNKFTSFNIVSSIIPNRMTPVIEDILIIICSTLNMTPLVTNDSEIELN